MRDKKLQDEIDRYRAKLQPQIDKVCDEYAQDVQQFVIDIHKDISNKFSQNEEWDQFISAISVVQCLLFDQICRTLAPVGSARYWKAVVDNMQHAHFERCHEWLRIYEKHHKENKNVSMD